MFIGFWLGLEETLFSLCLVQSHFEISLFCVFIYTLYLSLSLQSVIYNVMDSKYSEIVHMDILGS